MGQLIQHKQETIHWRETEKLGGNMFNLNPRPTMLIEGGTKVLRSFKTPGRDWGHGRTTTWFQVVYDESYVTEWLLQKVVNSFPNITHLQLREMFTKAMKLRKEREEKRLNGDG